MARLLVRLNPEEGESSQGYLLRLVDANALGSARRVEAAWLMNAKQAGLLRGPIAGVAHLNAPDPGGLPARYWNTRRPRFCPQCLVERPIWRSMWGLVFCVACHIHRTQLLDRCTACRQPLRWSRSALLRCRCGADLRQQHASAASDATVMASSALASAWRGGESATGSPRCRMQVEALMQRIWLLGSYRSEIASRAQKISGLHVVETAARIVEAAGEVLSCWPESYFEFLDRVADRYGNAESPHLGARFGAFYRKLFSADAKSFADLRRGFEVYLRRRWSGQIAGRNRRLSLKARRSYAWIPVARAAKRLHWRSSRLRTAIERGLVRGELRTTPSGRITGVVHKDDLLRLERESATWINLVEAARVLHAGKTTVHRLRTSGDLAAVAGPLVDGHCIWQFRSADVERLRQERLMRRVGEPACKRPCSSASALPRRLRTE